MLPGNVVVQAHYAIWIALTRAEPQEDQAVTWGERDSLPDHDGDHVDDELVHLACIKELTDQVRPAD